MKSQKKVRSLIILFFILLLPPIVYFYVTRGSNTFIELQVVGKKDHKIPEFTFVNQNNKVITRDSLQGHIYITNFFFTSCPTICPKMIKNMAYLQDQLSVYPGIRFLSHTVDPTNDTPERMLNYVENLKDKNVYIDLANWDFVTGDKEALYNIAQSYLVSAGYKDSLAPGGFVHSPNFILVDKEGRVRTGIDADNNPVGAYDGGNEAQMKDLINDVKVLMAEYQRPDKNDEK
tara:strand:- start:893 stop:1588 length:696 start_codon:yes stop_codon:yes gene_type:complete